MVQATIRTLSLEDFLQQPETKPASEYIDGQIIQKPMPKADHSTIQGDLTAAINTAIRSSQTGSAFPELRCTFDGRSMVPNIAVLPWEVIPRLENGKVGGDFGYAPEWMIEILPPPEQSQTRVVKKMTYALAQGTQMGWLIDPAEECVFAYTPDMRMVLYEEADTRLPVPEFAAAFELTVGELVGWLYA